MDTDPPNDATSTPPTADRDRRLDYDFDYLKRLAEESPESFEHVRERMIDAIIADAPESSRRRLRGIQWQLDMVREKSTNPMNSCVEMSQLMWEKVAGRDGLLDQMYKLSAPVEESAENPPISADQASATLLPFRLNAGLSEPDSDDRG